MVLCKCVVLKVFLELILGSKLDVLNCSMEDSSHINSRKTTVRLLKHQEMSRCLVTRENFAVYLK